MNPPQTTQRDTVLAEELWTYATEACQDPMVAIDAEFIGVDILKFFREYADCDRMKFAHVFGLSRLEVMRVLLPYSPLPDKLDELWGQLLTAPRESNDLQLIGWFVHEWRRQSRQRLRKTGQLSLDQVHRFFDWTGLAENTIEDLCILEHLTVRGPFEYLDRRRRVRTAHLERVAHSGQIYFQLVVHDELR